MYEVKRFLSMACLVSLFVVFVNEVQAQKFVTQNGAGNKNGLSWVNTSDDLQLMIDQYGTNGEVWVASGVYTPKYNVNGSNYTNINDYPLKKTAGNSPDNAFVLKPNVKVYGGFSNTGNSTWSQHDWVANPTYLGMNQSCNHIVISAGNVGTACLDGFTTQWGAAVIPTSITVNGVSNISGYYGGGIVVCNSSPVFANLIIKDNQAEKGGGVYIVGNSSPTLNNVDIYQNYASRGCRLHIANNAFPILIDVKIHENYVRSGGGDGDGIYFDNINNIYFPAWQDVEIYENKTGLVGVNSGDDGEIYVSGCSNFELSGVIVRSNEEIAHISKQPSGLGGGIYVENSSFTLYNSVVSHNKAIWYYNHNNVIIYGNGGGVL
jgi:hypothetical protein